MINKQKNKQVKFILLSVITLFSVFLIINFATAYTTANCYTGGNVTINGNKCVHTFYTNGTLNITGTITNAQALLVAGGGSGGGGNNNFGGGGGSGGILWNSSFTLTAGTYPVGVGKGGAGVVNSNGNNGENSTFYNMLAIGGGAGGKTTSSSNNGGSGGGSSESDYGGIYGISTQLNYNGIGYGNRGGISPASFGTGGGGGAGQIGRNGSAGNIAGNGGYGMNFTIFNGTNITYACGGGGGGSNISLGGIGGCYSAGNGNAPYGYNFGHGNPAINNTGSGGGGGAGNISSMGGAGGSGIVIVSYDVFLSLPTIEFNDPTDENGDSYQRQNILVNITSNTDNITVYFYNSTYDLVQTSTSSTSPFFYNYSTGTDGIFYFNATGCYTLNTSICNSTETRFVDLDTFNPVIDILFPSDILYIGEGYYNYFVNSTNFTALNTGTIDTCWIVLNDASPIYVPNCSEGTLMTYEGLNTVEGLNNLTIYANDTVSLEGSHTHQFYVDTIAPNLEIVNPLNDTIYTSSIQPLNISTDGTNIIFNVNDGFNYTYTGLTFVDFDEGTNVLDVWSYDNVGNVNFSTITFTVNTPSSAPSVTSNAIYQILNTTGAGLGIFIQILAQALPVLLILLGIVGVILIIGASIKKYLVEGGSP